jgi:cob(I)alamin adenosyltransferase
MGKSGIYTGKGDGGLTSLVGGKKTTKFSPRVEAYGTIDELNAFIACLMEEVDGTEDGDFLRKVQSELFDIGAYIASPAGDAKCGINWDAVFGIENEIDKIDEILPPVRSFILPGGSRANALANVCRTVCRRAERIIFRIHAQSGVDEIVRQYINRLSDYFFVLGRKFNLLKGINENFWEKRS